MMMTTMMVRTVLQLFLPEQPLLGAKTKSIRLQSKIVSILVLITSMVKRDTRLSNAQLIYKELSSLYQRNFLAMKDHLRRINPYSAQKLNYQKPFLRRTDKMKKTQLMIIKRANFRLMFLRRKLSSLLEITSLRLTTKILPSRLQICFFRKRLTWEKQLRAKTQPFLTKSLQRSNQFTIVTTRDSRSII